MIYLIALIPATALTIAGYFVLYLSNRSEGAFRAFGKYLGFWAFTLAGLVVLGAIFAAAHGGRHCPMSDMRGMHERMQAPWHGDPGSFDPREDELRGAGHAAEIPPGPAPHGPAGAVNPTAPPGGASPAPH